MKARRGHAEPEPAPRSFNDFYRATYSEVLRFIGQYAGPGVDAENIVAEAFTRTYRRWPDLQSPSSWVYTVAMNLARSAGTRGQRIGPVADPCPDDRTVAGWTSAAQLPGAEWGVQMSAIEDGLRQLPDQQRAAVLLSYQGWEPREIAATLGCKTGTVRVHLHLGRRRLDEILGEHQPAPQATPSTGLEGRTA